MSRDNSDEKYTENINKILLDAKEDFTFLDEMPTNNENED